MSETMTPQTILLGQAVITGVLVGFFYDIFRIIRRIIPPRYATIILQDILFWILSAIGVFFAAIWWGGGVVRIYFLIAVLAAALFYCLTVGNAIVFIFDKIIMAIKTCLRATHKYVMSPVFRFAAKVISKGVEIVKNMVKNHEKSKKKKKDSCKMSNEIV